MNQDEVDQNAGTTLTLRRSVLEKLVRLELLHTIKDGNRRDYDVNRARPLYAELRGIVLKTLGLRDILLAALKGGKIVHAFVFGSIAAATESAGSDVDLMVIGTTTHRQVASGLRRAGEALAREINAHFFTEEEFLSRVANRDHFVSDVVAKPKLFIVGDEHEFTDMVESRLAATPPNES